MTILNVTEARSKLYSLIDETSVSHQPVVITGKRSNAVLISETLNLTAIPGMHESIKAGIETPIE